MGSFEFRKELFGVAASSIHGLSKTLADSLVRIRACRDVERSLMGVSVLHHTASPAFRLSRLMRVSCKSDLIYV